jgi:predicted enzyme related to lactoylglutathione lyase
MASTAIATANNPIWIDLSSQDPAASRAFYGKLFGWQIDVNPDPLLAAPGKPHAAPGGVLI